jgi:hypothetical protein
MLAFDDAAVAAGVGVAAGFDVAGAVAVDGLGDAVEPEDVGRMALTTESTSLVAVVAGGVAVGPPVVPTVCPSETTATGLSSRFVHPLFRRTPITTIATMTSPTISSRSLRIGLSLWLPNLV